MGVRRLSFPAVAQPSGWAEIDRSADASTGIVFDAEFWAGNGGRDLAGGVVPANTVGLPTAVGSAVGQGADFTSAVLGYGDIELITGSKMTIEVLVQPDTTSQTAAIVQKRTAFNSENSWALWFDAGGTLWFEIGNSTGTASAVKYGISASALDTSAQHIIATLDGSAAINQKIQFYRNGMPVSISSVNDDNTTSSIYNSTTPVEVGRINNSTLYFDGKVYFVRIYNTWFSEDRAKRHAENYWQFFREYLNVPVAAAGGGANFTWTSSGGVSLAGAATAAEANNYAQAAAGGLAFGGSATATGAAGFSYTAAGGIVLAGAATAAEANNYAQTAAGGLSFSGAAATSGGGSFDFIASGGLLLAGAAGAAFTAAHQFAGSGGITLAGAFAALEFNNYLHAASGGVAISGSASCSIDTGGGVEPMVSLERYTIHATARQFEIRAKPRRTEIKA